MIRPPILSDKQGLTNLFSSLNLFDSQELEFMSDLVDSFIHQTQDEGHYWLVNDNKGITTAAAYYAPESFGHNVYNLYFIGVLPNQQGKRLGSNLLQYIENHLKQLDQRLLLVETSGLPSFEQTREFYKKNDYQKEAVIRDYYKDGDDKITYIKKLNEGLIA